MKADATALLDRLLALYWRGGVTQARAAQLVGIRRDEFVELAELRRAVLMLEAAAWRHFLSAFLYRFPECDQRAVRRESDRGIAAGSRMYTDDELLMPPHPAGNGTANRSAPPKIGVGMSPPANPRALPRDTGQQSSFDWAA